jgi:hypothetical protein
MRLRAHAPALLFAAVGVWSMFFLGLYGFAWSDYDVEATPAYDALISGHVWRFVTLLPGYGGSLELRAPFALLPSLWGGDDLAVYRAVALPCLLAAALLAVWLVAQMRRLGASRLARGATIGLCVANPITMQALVYGHPEELLGAVLCVAAVLAATRGRALWAGALLGLAIVNKDWALLAAGPVLLALPAGRTRATLMALALSALFYAPMITAQVLAHGGSGTALANTTSGRIFQPWQAWWFLGSLGHPVYGTFGTLKIGYRTPPAWLTYVPHPLIIMLGSAISLAAARRVRSGLRLDPLALLALLLAVRCAFDSWDTLYYPLPLIMAVLAWESVRGRPPLFTLLGTAVTWAIFVSLPGHISPDAQAVLFQLVAVVVLSALSLAVFAPGAAARLWRACTTGQRRAPRLEAAR